MPKNFSNRFCGSNVGYLRTGNTQFLNGPHGGDRNKMALDRHRLGIPLPVDTGGDSPSRRADRPILERPDRTNTVWTDRYG